MTKYNKKKVFSALKRKHVAKGGTYLTLEHILACTRSWPESVMEKWRKGRPTTAAAKLTLEQSKQQ